MSERLRELVSTTVIKTEEVGAVEALALRAKVSPSLVRKVMSNGYIPSAKKTYKLALACGCTEGEALALARGASKTREKKSA